MSPSNCTFCNIISRKLPAEILFENQHVVSILDINPIHFGHALVIPKSHCKDFIDLPREFLPEIFHCAQIVAQAMVTGLRLEGFNIFSNNGRIAGQSVFHFHLHVTPRYEDDNIKFVLKLKSYENGEMERYAGVIRQHIKT
ncbi:MAG: HIT domain-containing protein [Ignavibacteriales bacterium]|nr:HIT domain-containing protein [Ignavibacteriales bacterium]